MCEPLRQCPGAAPNIPYNSHNELKFPLLNLKQCWHPLSLPLLSPPCSVKLNTTLNLLKPSTSGGEERISTSHNFINANKLQAFNIFHLNRYNKFHPKCQRLQQSVVYHSLVPHLRLS